MDNEAIYNETIHDDETSSYCELDPNYYSWYTEYDQGHLVPLSFKIGLFFGIQIAIMVNQRAAMFRKAWGKAPFIIQALFALSGAVWVASDYSTVHDASTSWMLVVGILLDILVKSLVIYFICIRLIVIAPLDSNQGLLVLCKLLVFLGLVISVVTLIPDMIWQSLSDEEYNYWSQFYFITDNYISFIEILTIYIFISRKFRCQNVTETWREAVKMKLQPDLIVVFGSALFSLCLTILQFSLERNPDYDYSFYNIATALKYASSCNIVVALFQKSALSTKGNTAGKDSSISQSAAVRKDSISQSVPLRSVTN